VLFPNSLCSFITNEIPFKEYSAYEAFVKAICDDKIRPIIPKTFPTVLEQLVQDCWNSNATARPEFHQIIDKLDPFEIEALIPDKAAQAIWKKHSSGQTYVSLKQFLKKLMKDDLHVNHIDENDTEFKCLSALLALHENEVRHEELSNIEKFGLLIYWFGPLDSSLLPRIMTTLKAKWFHGYISKEEAESILEDQKPGTFLVRLSTTDPAHTPFTISKVGHKGDINHQRINVRSDSKGFFVHTPVKGTVQKVTHSGDLVDFFSKKIRSLLYLKYPIGGSKFEAVFQGETESFIGSYQVDMEEADFTDE